MKRMSIVAALIVPLVNMGQLVAMMLIAQLSLIAPVRLSVQHWEPVRSPVIQALLIVMLTVSAKTQPLTPIAVVAVYLVTQCLARGASVVQAQKIRRQLVLILPVP
jgi:hypothetical protein